jgi:serine/threonine protein kinase
MSEKFKEPEMVKTDPPKKERIELDEPPKSKPIIVESSDFPTDLPAPVIRDPYLGTVINDRYRVLSLIGKGATSAVYKAEDTELNQTVAIKILHSHLIADATILRRFEQEAKTDRLLKHPNIPGLRGCSRTSDGIPFLVMDLVEGASLEDAIKAAGWIPAERAIVIFDQVCAALGAAHEKGIVHRDLKPSNIMLTETPDGSLLVKVLDFGVAKLLPATGNTVLKLTQTGEMLGSILYMSPEQCLDKELDGRSDCYSLGCVMYEALTGKPPLAARTAFETMNKHMTDMPESLARVRPDVNWPPGLEDVVFKALAKDPNKRYQKITALQDDLQRLRDGTLPTLAQLTSDKILKGVTRSEESSGDRVKAINDTLNNLFGQSAPLSPEGKLLGSIAIVVILMALVGPFALALASNFFYWASNTSQSFIMTLVLLVIFGAYVFWAFFSSVRPAASWQPVLFGPSPLIVSVTNIAPDRTAEHQQRFRLVIHPNSSQQFLQLKIELIDDNRSLTISDASEISPIPAVVYVNWLGTPVAVTVQGARARVVK